MPDAQSMNQILGTYGMSNPAGGGGFNWWNIIAGIIFGIIGWYAFMYGKREKIWRPMVIGILLMAYPYFVPNAILVFVIGIALTFALIYWKE